MKGGNAAILIAGQARSLADNLDSLKEFVTRYSKESERYCEVFFYIDPHVNFPWQEDAPVRCTDLCTIRLDVAIRRVFDTCHVRYYDPMEIHREVASKRLNDAGYLYFQSAVERDAWGWAKGSMPNITHVMKLRPDATYSLSLDFDVFHEHPDIVLKHWDMCFHCTSVLADIVCSQCDTIQMLDLETLTGEPVTIHNVHYTHLKINDVSYMELRFCTLNRHVTALTEMPLSNTNNTYIPIGIQCTCAELLKAIGLRRCAYPFDWMFSHVGAVRRILGGAACLRPPQDRVTFHGFEHFAVGPAGYYLADRECGLVCPHSTLDDFDAGGKFERRLHRLAHVIGDGTCKVLVYCTEMSPDTRYTIDGVRQNDKDAAELVGLCDDLDKRGVSYRVLAFDFVGRFETVSHPRLTVLKMDPGLHPGHEGPPFIPEIDNMVARLRQL